MNITYFAINNICTNNHERGLTELTSPDQPEELFIPYSIFNLRFSRKRNSYTLSCDKVKVIDRYCIKS